MLVSISSTFYKQLLRAQIPKAQKDSQVVSLFCAFYCFENIGENWSWRD